MITILVARKPISELSVKDSVLLHSTGTLNLRDTRIPGPEKDRFTSNFILQHSFECLRNPCSCYIHVWDQNMGILTSGKLDYVKEQGRKGCVYGVDVARLSRFSADSGYVSRYFKQV